MAKDGSLWCRMKECRAPFCKLAGGGTHQGTGCNQDAAAEGLQLVCRGVSWSWLPSPAWVMYRCYSSLFADAGFLGSTWSWMIHQAISLSWFISRMLFIITFFLSFFFLASALSFCSLWAHGVNDNQPCSWGARCGSNWVSGTLLAEGDSGVMSLFTDPWATAVTEETNVSLKGGTEKSGGCETQPRTKILSSQENR